MLKTSLIALGFAAILAGSASADPRFEGTNGVSSPRITSQIVNETRNPDGVDGFTTRSISNSTYAAPQASTSSPRIDSQNVLLGR
jgi:hypothetical protein